MEAYAVSRKGVETSGAEDPMGWCASKDLKAAAASAIGPHGLFAAYSIKGKADKQTAASDVERAFEMAAVAAAMAQQAMDAAKQAVALAAAAKQAEEEAGAKQQAEEEEEAAAAAAAADDGATDSEDEGEEVMTRMEYLRTYKELHPYEVGCILRNPVVRKPFTGTEKYKALSADPDATQDDMDKACKEHEEHLDRRTRFHDWVRSEYEAKGYVAVSDEYIAMREVTAEFSRKLWEEAFADDSDSDDYDDSDYDDGAIVVEEVAH